MSLDELKGLLEQLKSDASAVSDEQLAAAMDEIRSQVAEQRKATPNQDVIAVLRDLKGVREAVVAEQASRAEAAAQLAQETAGLLDELDTEPEAPAASVPGEGDSGNAAPVESATPDAPAAETPAGDPPPESPSDIAAVAASLAALTDVLKMQFGITASGETNNNTNTDEGKPTGRSAGRLSAHAPDTAAPASRDAVRLEVRAAGSVGSYQHGQPIASTIELGKVVADRLRGASARGGRGEKLYVANVVADYPDSRLLRADDVEGNYTKIENVTSTPALVAAGGLCAPLETLYDVSVLGSTSRPVRDALARFGVDRGGIQYRPNTSAAAAVYGAGVWTVADDAANPVGSKGCYVVDCPGIQEAVVEAIYLCLEFSNITARFDPETTASNVQQGMIAHARLAENELLRQLAAGSKILSAAQVIGATRDILVNLDKSTAYYRNRHRIEDSIALTMIMPGWVKSLMRADLARQMATDNWMDALGLADDQILQWFTRRNVTPVWHLDGPTGLDEVQTVTITGSPTGGTFTLTFNGQTTGNIAYNATAATVQAALEALSNINVGDVTVAGGPGPGTPWTVTFDATDSGGQFHGANVSQMTAAGSFTGGTSPAVGVTTTTGGGGAITVNGISINSQTYPDAAAGSSIPGFPDTIDALLFQSGSWLFLDGGNLDLGLVRDSTLNDRNRYRQFTETFEGVANRGIESLRLVMSVQPTGATVGTISQSGIND
jgi:hypothetical protein